MDRLRDKRLGEGYLRWDSLSLPARKAAQSCVFGCPVTSADVRREIEQHVGAHRQLLVTVVPIGARTRPCTCVA